MPEQPTATTSEESRATDDELAVQQGARALLDVAVRRSPTALDRLLDTAFTEVDPTGTTSTRSAGIEALQAPDGAAAGPQPVHFHGMRTDAIGRDVALYTYTLSLADRRLSCASVWRHADGRWRLRHHQQTTITAST